MAGGPRYGAQYGGRYGAVYGPSNKVIGSGGIPGVSRDSTSQIYVPANATEWTTFIAAAGLSIAVPNALWLMQEASGNPADSIGAFTLTAGGTPAYQQAVTGWTRKAITYADNAGAGLVSTSASLPDILTNSLTLLSFSLMPTSAPGGTRQISSGGVTTASLGVRTQVTNTSFFRSVSGANGANGTANVLNATRPIVLKHDQTNDVCTAYSDQEKISPAHDALANGQRLCFGGQTGATSAAGGPLYACAWFNANAEISDANIKALLQAMGWTIPW